jgi:hypothetical protein
MTLHTGNRIRYTTLVYRVSGDSLKEITDSSSSCTDLGEETSQHKDEDEVWRRENTVSYGTDHSNCSFSLGTLFDQSAYVTHKLSSQII